MNQTRNTTLGSLVPSVGAIVALLGVGGSALGQAPTPWLGVSNVLPTPPVSAPAPERPKEEVGEPPRAESATAPAKVHGTITVDFEKVTIAELLRLTKTLEQVDGVIHIVAAGGGGEQADDRAVVTISRPGAPALILGEERAARDQARLLTASPTHAPTPRPPTAPRPASDRSTATAFPRLASLGRLLGFQPHPHHHQASPDPRSGPMTVTWEPRESAGGSADGVLRASRDATASGPAAPTTLEPAPEALEIGSRLDALSAGRPISEKPAPAAPPPAGSQAQASSPPRRRVATADDSFESLSQAFYGDARYARALWWANRGEVAWPGALTAGKRIVIPAPGELEPRMIVSPEPAGIALSPKPEPTEARYDPAVRPASFTQTTGEQDQGQGPDQDEGGFSIHVVRPEDTLRIIAREVCGDERKALEIIALNRDILSPEGRIRVGQRLLMPAADKPSP